MKPGQESQTSVLVCADRAVAHQTAQVPRFSDPTALALLPEDKRQEVERFLAAPEPTGLKARMGRALQLARGHMMGARTVEIDEAVRQAGHPQLVILGAGLDGRAWRMGELRDTVVFEVDHPDTQRAKRARADKLTPVAREVRFVPVDFTRDKLEEALRAAGHDADRPTTWIWEGVVMYLTRDQIAATLEVLARRSAVGSRLIIAYHRPALILNLLSGWVRRLGEPLRSSFTAPAMRSLLARFGFSVVRDEDLGTIGTELAPEVGEATRSMRHLRIVTADRR
ncbi:MAG TPA: class I SAM-dependent methyltransferase [Stenomitos sp.]